VEEFGKIDQTFALFCAFTYLRIFLLIYCACRFVSSLRLYVSHIVGYQRLMVEVEHKRRTSYSSDNDEHEALLMQVCECEWERE